MTKWRAKFIKPTTKHTDAPDKGRGQKKSLLLDIRHGGCRVSPEKKKGLDTFSFFLKTLGFLFSLKQTYWGGEDLARARLFCLLFSSALLSLFFLCSCNDGGMVDEGLQDILDRRSVVMCNTHKCLVVELLGLLLLSEVCVCVCVCVSERYYK